MSCTFVSQIIVLRFQLPIRDVDLAYMLSVVNNPSVIHIKGVLLSVRNRRNKDVILLFNGCSEESKK